jgi:2,4-dienoyl-CoA reductase-like NADH-dependent reductase (Old Yellow Enzyme family)
VLAVLFLKGTTTMTAPLLFTPIKIGPVELPNRIVISPMCQYSAVDGNVNDWHHAHLGSLSLSGAGLLYIEATAITPEGRITPGCVGLYSEQNFHALKKLVDSLRAVSPIKLAIQLGHAGRKASSHRPWEGGELMTPSEGGWPTFAPSAIAHKEGELAPKELSKQHIKDLIQNFSLSARRARDLGLDVIEVHAAHGYLLHEFLSPLSNARSDEYGGSLENRMRFVLEAFEAVRAAAGPNIAVGARLSATDWVEGGWDVEQSITLSKRLQAMGADFLDISSGGVSPHQKISIGPGYQVPFAEKIKAEISIPVMTVGLITEPKQAEDILQHGKADMVALARGMIAEPRWPWRAAAELGGTVQGSTQYYRCLPSGYPSVFGAIKTSQR